MVKRKIGKGLPILLFAGIVCGVGILFFVLLGRQMLEGKGDSSEEMVTKYVSAALSVGGSEEVRAALEKIQAEALERQEQDRLLAEYAMKNPEILKSDITLPKEGDKYAVISIERLNMSVPLYYGDTNALLKKGAGQYIGAGSAIFGEGKQILVAGHNTKEFKPLQNAEVGDIVKVTTTYGEFAYQIVRIQVYNMNDKESYDFNLDHEQLAMYTCYPFSGPPGKTERYFCYCDKLYGPVLKD